MSSVNYVKNIDKFKNSKNSFLNFINYIEISKNHCLQQMRWAAH